MKPVPILQYLDHFGRVAPANEPPAARAPGPVPFKPRTLRAVPDPAPRPPLSLARALREPGAPRAEGSPSPRSRAAPSEAEIGARIAEAYGRGRQDGAVAARLEEAEAVARVVAEEQRTIDGGAARLPTQRIRPDRRSDLDRPAGARTARRGRDRAHSRAAADRRNRPRSRRGFERGPRQTAGRRIAGPRFASAVPKRVLVRLTRTRRLSCRSTSSMSSEGGVEVTIEAEDTTIRSALQPWADLIESLTR